MSNDYNPFKDIFSNIDFNRLQDNSISLISAIARESEKGLSAFMDCLQDTIQSGISSDIPNTPYDENSTSSSSYECPMPQQCNPITMNDMFNISSSEPANKDTMVNNPERIDTVKTSSEVINTMKDQEKDTTPIDPFSQPKDTSNNSSIDSNGNATNEPKKETSLTDREVIDKTSSMWKYYPIKDSPETLPERITQTGSTPYAQIVASRVRGKKHKHDSTNCDDYFSFSLVGNCCVVAVSDGAGSKVYSRIGAKEVTTSYTNAMGSALETLLSEPTFLEGLSRPITDALFNKSCSNMAIELQNAVKSAYSALVSRFDAVSNDELYSKPLGRDVNLNDLSCTLLSAIIIPIETNDGVETLVATLQIGDGLICSVDDSKPFDSAVKVLGVSDSGNFSGETEFVTADGMMERSNLMRRIKVMKGKTSAVILATDGVADDYFPIDTKACILYDDLILNGIVSIDIQQDNSIKIVPPIREHKTIEETPTDVCVAYCEDIQDFFKIDDATIWNDRSYIKNAISVYSQFFSDNSGKNLESWLDNYTKRGSFDDRTLFLYRPIK